MSGYDGSFKEAANVIINERLGNKFKKGSFCGGCGSCASCKGAKSCDSVPVTVTFTTPFELNCGMMSSPLYEAIGDCGPTVTIVASVTSPETGTACIATLVIVRSTGETIERILPAPVTPGATGETVLTVTNVKQVLVRCVSSGQADQGCAGSLTMTSTYCAPGGDRKSCC
ncbi:hypothetical protein [Alteribacter aurantiacus]|uniref:hypothetical protein n=1 Tax=Alteribacter aurantiacus TaxID=254410 RepID=UPI0003F96AB0|nr:hypothetical protein [Alteribacter aurantiacus]